MTLKRNGLNDFDKIFVTVALWISAVTVFVTALTLPMLPDKVSIFYRPIEGAQDDSYSKYNNLFLIFASIIPATIVLIAAVLKRRNRLNNNFASIMLFSIMLSICIGSIVIFGIEQQFDASFSVKDVEVHGVSCMFISFVLSVMSCFQPILLRGELAAAEANETDEAISKTRRFATRVAHNAVAFWGVGAYGYILIAVACTFTPAPYCYIPLCAGFVAHALFIMLKR